MVTLDAHDDATTADVHIKMYSDKSFDFILDLMNMGKVLGGTWASTDSTGQNPMADIRLTVDPASLPDGMESPIGDTVDVKITPLNEQYTAFKYTCAVVYNVPNQITMNLKFVGGYPSGTEVPHVNTDSDNKCDDCGADMPVVGECEHLDANHDGVCDKNCGKTDITVSHTDANHDGVCDAESCNATVDYAHKDINADDKCDVCEQTMITECKYTSDTVKIWSNTQSATLVLNNITAPDSKPTTDKTVYGNVFYLTVGTMGEFLSGTWSIENNTLMLTANWGDGANETKLTEATSGVAKSYTLSSGKYAVVVDLPSAANTVFTINVGGSVTDPCTEHVDTNPVDGKCDKCGEDMPTQEEKTLLVTLNATDSATTYQAEIKMYNDGSFDFILGGSKVFGGTWASSNTTGQNPLADIVLTYDSNGSPVVGETDTMTITPSQDYSSMTYTCHVDYVVPQTITMSFDFIGTYVVQAQPPVTPTLLVTLNATDSATTYQAEIKMYNDGSFDFILGGSKVFGGTWASSDTTGQNPLADIVLTYDSNGSPVVGETDTMTITPSQDYSSMTYTCHVDYVVPETITMSFDFTGTLNLA